MKPTFLIPLLIGCGTEVQPRHLDNPIWGGRFGEFQPIVDSFEKKMESFNLPLKTKYLKLIEWGEVDKPSTLGICYRWRYKDGRSIPDKITLNIRYKYSSPARIKYVLYHELGHCAMLWEHSENKSSLMYKYAPNFVVDDMVDDALEIAVEETL